MFTAVLMDTGAHSVCQQLSPFGHTACGILVPRPGIEPGPLAVKVRSPDHWTSREFPAPPFLRTHSECRPQNVPMLKEPTWWPDASTGLRADLGSKSGSAVSSVHGLRQVNVPLCTEFSHMCKGGDQTQSLGVGVRVK